MVDCGRARDHDKKSDNIRNDTSDDYIEPAQVVMTRIDASLDDGRLKIELHPRRNGCTYQTHNNRQVAGIGTESRDESLLERKIPVRFSQEG